MLGQFSQVLPMTLDGSDDLHLLPVVGKFFATIQAHDVGTREGSRRVATRPRTNRNGKTAMRVPTTEASVE